MGTRVVLDVDVIFATNLKLVEDKWICRLESSHSYSLDTRDEIKAKSRVDFIK